MRGIPDDPIIRCMERTGFPPWFFTPEESDEPDEPDESPWPAILSNLEAYGNPAGACLYELPPKGGTDNEL